MPPTQRCRMSTRSAVPVPMFAMRLVGGRLRDHRIRAADWQERRTVDVTGAVGPGRGCRKSPVVDWIAIVPSVLKTSRPWMDRSTPTAVRTEIRHGDRRGIDLDRCPSDRPNSNSRPPPGRLPHQGDAREARRQHRQCDRRTNSHRAPDRGISGAAKFVDIRGSSLRIALATGFTVNSM